jgi:nitrate reductase gamma subunit
MAEEDEIVVWARRQRRNAGLRVSGIGLLVLVPSLVWLLAYMDWDSASPVTRIKVVGGVAVAVGGSLVLAGLVMLWRSRIDPEQIPTATARTREP